MTPSRPSKQAPQPTWRNVAGTVSATPRTLSQPENEAQIAQVLQQAAQRGQGVRVVGAGHAQTPLAAGNDVLLSLQQLSGIEHYDPHTGEVTVWGGTRLDALGEALRDLGRAQENLDELGTHTVAGAVATGVHGTGLGLGSLSTQVTAMRLIDAQGNVQQLQGDDPRLAAACVSLGALGVVSSVTLKTQRAYNLRQEFSAASFAEALHLWPEYAQAARHFAFAWVPHTHSVQLQRGEPSGEAPTARRRPLELSDRLRAEGAVRALSEAHRRWPGLTGPVTRGMSWLGSSPTGYTQAAHRAFVRPRIAAREMEYALPLEALSSALLDLRAMLERTQLPVSLPITVRFSAGDELYLSAAYGAARAHVSIQAYPGAAHQDYFRESEQIFTQHAGRPHWGKLHSLGEKELRRLYPQFEQFKRLQDHLDPQRRFGSAYLRHILGA